MKDISFGFIKTIIGFSQKLTLHSLDYKLDDYQLEQDWNNILSLANQPGYYNNI